jgi:hypothetical protein
MPKAKQLWVSIENATREQMQLAFAQEREEICRRLYQMAVDCDVYNRRFNKGEPIKIVFDFTEDVAEHMALPPEVGNRIRRPRR